MTLEHIIIRLDKENGFYVSTKVRDKQMIQYFIDSDDFYESWRSQELIDLEVGLISVYKGKLIVYLDNK